MKSTNVVETTIQLSNQDINVIVTCTIQALSSPVCVIRSYMPLSKGLRPKYLLLILMAVKALKQPSKAMIIKAMQLNSNATIKAVDYLNSLGYISKCGKPRLIIPFQRYKVDTGYVITELGERVLKKILLAKL